MERARPKRGEIWYIENNNFTGSEAGFTRPAIIVSNEKNNLYSGVIEVVYLTTQKRKELPTHIKIRSSPKISTALCEQVYSVSIERLKEKCGTVTLSEQGMIDKALLISLGIEEITPPPQKRAGGGVQTQQITKKIYSRLNLNLKCTKECITTF